jgi:glycosyltransferase involved in cell wall biosynthesis
MKVLVVSRGVKPVSPSLAGGAEHVMWRLAEEAARRGHEVHVVTDADPATRLHPGVRTHRVGVPAAIAARLRKSGFVPWILLHLVGNLLAFFRAAYLLRTARPRYDVIHCHGNLSAFLLTFARRGTPLLYTEHDSTPWSCAYPARLQRLARKVLYRAINVQTFRRADLTAVLYEDHRDEINRRWGVSFDRLAVIPNGVDTSVFAPASAGQAQSRSVNGASRTSVPSGYTLFVGRLEARKGVDLLLEAVSRAPESPNCLIVGDGPARRRLEQLSAKLGLSDRVTFAGEVKHAALPDYYRNAAIFALPSHAEAFPLTALEAMACGTPVVASRVGAAGWLINTTGCGVLFKPGDPAGLASALTSLSASEDQVRAMGVRGRRSTVEQFSWARVGARVTGIYGSLTSPRPAFQGDPGKVAER